MSHDVTPIYCDATYQRDTARLDPQICWSYFASFTASLCFLTEGSFALSQMSSAKDRSTHARAILGPELYARLANTNVLLVGAGGIGCELRKWPKAVR